ncbi:unnamed protein product [marine sediment metagenome]|uniref:Uncharacterized protein n=1 Tax=marine sediment metagenome TaxID=412755 RepID=X0XL19_9ZZZZ
MMTFLGFIKLMKMKDAGQPLPDYWQADCLDYLIKKSLACSRFNRPFDREQYAEAVTIWGRLNE